MDWESMMFSIESLYKILALFGIIFVLIISIRQIKSIWDEKFKTFRIKEIWVMKFDDGPNRKIIRACLKILNTNNGKVVYPEFIEIEKDNVRKCFNVSKKEGVEYGSMDIVSTPFSDDLYKKFMDKEVKIYVIDTFGRVSKPVKGVFNLGYIYREKETD